MPAALALSNAFSRDGFGSISSADRAGLDLAILSGRSNVIAQP